MLFALLSNFRQVQNASVMSFEKHIFFNVDYLEASMATLSPGLCFSTVVHWVVEPVET